MTRKPTATVFTSLIALLFATASMAQNRSEELSGEVTSVSPTTNRITVALEDGGTRTFTVDEDTDITFEGSFRPLRQGALEDIEAGDQVELIVDVDAGQERVRSFARDRSAQAATSSDRDADRFAVAQADIDSDSASQRDSQALGQQQQTRTRLPSTATAPWVYVLLSGGLMLMLAATLRLARARR